MPRLTPSRSAISETDRIAALFRNLGARFGRGLLLAGSILKPFYRATDRAARITHDTGPRSKIPGATVLRGIG